MAEIPAFLVARQGVADGRGGPAARGRIGDIKQPDNLGLQNVQPLLLVRGQVAHRLRVLERLKAADGGAGAAAEDPATLPL